MTASQPKLSWRAAITQAPPPKLQVVKRDWRLNPPRDAKELAEFLADPWARVTSGLLYKILVKDGESESIVPFVPNRNQRRLINRLWYRNLICKARQLGYTTLIAIMWLDHALFNANQRCGIIAQDDGAAKVIFRDKVRLAYNNLPQEIQDARFLIKASADELLFSNNSSIRVATSMRSGTIHRLHVSEFGKICAKYPEKANEVITGSLPSVPIDGITIIESTAEGQEGEFYKMTMRAKDLADSGRQLTPRDYRFHFTAWWQEQAYRLKPEDARNVIITPEDRRYFEEREVEIGKPIDQSQRAWYVATRESELVSAPEKMWQEYPSCVVGDTLVSTATGIRCIRDIKPDGQQVLAFMDKGLAPVFQIKTALGYSVTCTNDHPLLCADGEYRQLISGLTLGSEVQLAIPTFGTELQHVSYQPFGFMTSRIDITTAFAEFIGIYMGDGSFYDGTVSVAFDTNDADTVSAVEAMFQTHLGGYGERKTGDKKGCTEVRKSSVGLKEPFLALELIQQRDAGGMKRWVHVPSYIWTSPKDVIAAFLRGLFEADGFCSRDGTNIRFFSKHAKVVSDIQVLLLGFGIESKTSTVLKVSGSGATYPGSELRIRADGVREFGRQIKFISARKNARVSVGQAKAARKSAAFSMTDTIASVTAAGMQPVYDITTATANFIAGGIVVHNSPKEAFQVSTEGTYYANQLTAARKQGRITRVPYVEGIPVNTFWDIGGSDGTAIWLHQRVGLENRFIGFIEGWGEGYAYFIGELGKTGYLWGDHYLPHDASHQRQTKEATASPLDMLSSFKIGGSWIVVPVVEDVNHGIQLMRSKFTQCWFDEEHCAAGLAHLGSYKKRWNKQAGGWSSQPRKDTGHSEAADAIRQFAQGYVQPIPYKPQNLGRSAPNPRA